MPRKSKKAVQPEIIENSTPAAKVENTLAPGLGGGDPAFAFGFGLGFPQNQSSPWTPQISQVNTSFINLRWYLISNFRQFLSELYVEIGLVQTLVDVPVDDALRGGILIKSPDLKEEQIAELIASMDRDDDINIAGQAGKWNRLFGGAGILILTDQDPIEPLDLSSIDESTPLEFRAVDMWELFWDKQESEGYNPAIQEHDFQYYSYYGEQVHKSRVMRLTGMTIPSFIRPRMRGWGISVCEPLVRSLNQYLKATDLSFEVLDEFKVDVYKIKNLVNTLMAPQGAHTVKERVALANYQKNYQKALVMDSEDEWDHKQLSFAGLGDTMEQIRMQIASDLRMPMTKLFGISSAGFNSGEDDLEVYNAMVESQVRNKLKYPVMRMVEIKCQKLFGFVPKNLSVEFKPLRMLSAEQEENVKTQKFKRAIESAKASLITIEEFREDANRGNLFSITLDPVGIDGLTGFMADRIVEGQNDPDNPQDLENPGADRADSRMPRATEVGGIPKGNVKPPRDSGEAKDGAEFRKANSKEFDKASYAADGGDSWIDSRRKSFFEKTPKDASLWAEAKQRSREVWGSEKWQFTVWIYSKMGGKF